ncbi:MAG: suppressor of fused domain protein [Cyanobacteria bacterium J06588_5]
MTQEQKTVFEAIWETREETIYPNLFGDKYRGTFVLTDDVFTRVFGQASFDPRWLHYGVIEFEPTADRNSWLYVTSGASNPWEADPSDYALSEYSGFGTELVLEVPQQSQWAIITLQRLLAFNILLVHGRYGEVQPLDYGNRVPLRGPIDFESSALAYVVLAAPEHYAASFKLLSGKVDFLHVVGITLSERDYAQAHDSERLIALLKSAMACPVTDAARKAVV